MPQLDTALSSGQSLAIGGAPPAAQPANESDGLRPQLSELQATLADTQSRLDAREAQLTTLSQESLVLRAQLAEHTVAEPVGFSHLLAAPIGRRSLAFLIDAVASFAVAFAGMVLVVMVDNALRGPATPPIPSRVVGEWGYVFAATYLILPPSIWGATFGKRLLGLRVINNRGAKPGLGRMAIRTVAVLLLGVGLLPVLVVLFRGDRRGLHDLLAGTQVVEL